MAIVRKFSKLPLIAVFIGRTLLRTDGSEATAICTGSPKITASSRKPYISKRLNMLPDSFRTTFSLCSLSSDPSRPTDSAYLLTNRINSAPPGVRTSLLDSGLQVVEVYTNYRGLYDGGILSSSSPPLGYFVLSRGQRESYLAMKSGLGGSQVCLPMDL
ncbi:uncharacterized protein H6S33_003089 [Morchella sextelata]|uniref:uncharacterized protein n=1 Tax=Morchella sextelata TaxID=1174677 RepID=UPI001D041716|nr:uncharacterized protein H6S33_003089 [Morchella sextelata]KAH0607101.1 hypothetical protein H6S33_003089 [Morchella sextelata]